MVGTRPRRSRSSVAWYEFFVFEVDVCDGGFGRIGRYLVLLDSWFG